MWKAIRELVFCKKQVDERETQAFCWREMGWRIPYCAIVAARIWKEMLHYWDAVQTYGVAAKHFEGGMERILLVFDFNWNWKYSQVFSNCISPYIVLMSDRSIHLKFSIFLEGQVLLCHYANNYYKHLVVVKLYTTLSFSFVTLTTTIFALLFSHQIPMDISCAVI